MGRTRDFVNGEPFGIMHGDNAFLAPEGKPPCVAQLTNAFGHSQETTLAAALEDEEVLVRTAAFCGKPTSGNGSPLFKASELMAYPISPEVARSRLRIEGVPDG